MSDKTETESGIPGLSVEKIEQLKATHGAALSCVLAKTGPLVFRKPTRTEYDRWFDKNAANKAESSKNARELAKACRVYPDEAGLDAALEATPAILMCEVLNAVTGLAGLQETFAVKTL